VQNKLERIAKEKDKFPKTDTKICETDRFIWSRIASNLSMDNAETDDLMRRIVYTEEEFVLPVLLHKAKVMADTVCMINPLAANGLVIIGYIINVVAMKVLTGRA
jgi:hypothetical protein